jgi:hypothetical protein
MDHLNELIRNFKPNTLPSELDLPQGTPEDTRGLIHQILLQLYLANSGKERLKKENTDLGQRLETTSSTLFNLSGVSRRIFTWAFGGLALFILLCFIITWATRPSVGEIQEATRRHSVTEALREMAPNGVINLKDAGEKLGFEVIKTSSGETYISLPKE